MAILTGPEIIRQRKLNNIRIDPFDPEMIGPNSYNLRLSNELLTYDVWGSPHSPGRLLAPSQAAQDPSVQCLDAGKDNPIIKLKIPPEGFVLQPFVGYLGSIIERTATPYHVPHIDGRSSVGRLFLFVHVTAGRGDVAFDGTWTLELLSVYPLRVYAGMPIAQIAYHEAVGELLPYKGKYQNQTGPRASGLFREFPFPYPKSDSCSTQP